MVDVLIRSPRRTIRKDTAAYASLLSSLVKEQVPHAETQKQPRASSLLKGTSFWRLRQPVRENRAADEAYLDQPAAYVNTSQKFLADFLRGFVNYTKYN
jgi:hypothetical protein